MIMWVFFFCFAFDSYFMFFAELGFVDRFLIGGSRSSWDKFELMCNMLAPAACTSWMSNDCRQPCRTFGNDVAYLQMKSHFRRWSTIQYRGQPISASASSSLQLPNFYNSGRWPTIFNSGTSHLASPYRLDHSWYQWWSWPWAASSWQRCPEVEA